MSHLAALAADAIAALRQNPLRSLLSVLGLVIGVAALVAILAVADGMERYLREQVGTTTNVQDIVASPRTVESVDGVTLRRHRVAVPTMADAAALAARLGDSALVALVQRRPVEVVFDTIDTGANLYAAEAGLFSVGPVELASGRLFTAADVEAARPALVVSAALAARLGGSPAALVGRGIEVGGVRAEIVGVLASRRGNPEAYGPYTAFAAETEERPASFYARAARAEETAAVAAEVERWLDERFEDGGSAFTVATDEMRARQIRQGMLLFKLVFGLITGISVVVGGVGVMNVLLVTVTERTREIGIRKAVGARRRDIKLQFLAEAMTVAGAGSALGLIVGLAAVFAIIPVIRHVTEVSFHAAVTGETLLIVALVAVAVGLLFGTYPAARAARLDPVDAMRHE